MVQAGSEEESEKSESKSSSTPSLFFISVCRCRKLMKCEKAGESSPLAQKSLPLKKRVKVFLCRRRSTGDLGLKTLSALASLLLKKSEDRSFSSYRVYEVKEATKSSLSKA